MNHSTNKESYISKSDHEYFTTSEIHSIIGSRFEENSLMDSHDFLDMLLLVFGLENDEFIWEEEMIQQVFSLELKGLMMPVFNVANLDQIIFTDYSLNEHKSRIIIDRIHRKIKVLKTKYPENQHYQQIVIYMQLICERLSDYFVGFNLEFPLSEEERKIKIEVPDSRFSTKAPTSPVRVKALEYYCPELWKFLRGRTKKDQETIIHQITGVNKTDAYKLSFGNTQNLKEAVDTKVFIKKESQR